MIFAFPRLFIFITERICRTGCKMDQTELFYRFGLQGDGFLFISLVLKKSCLSLFCRKTVKKSITFRLIIIMCPLFVIFSV